MSAYTGMVTSRAKNAKETRLKTLEMEERAGRVTELSGREIDVMHASHMIPWPLSLENMG